MKEGYDIDRGMKWVKVLLSINQNNYNKFIQN